MARYMEPSFLSKQDLERFIVEADKANIYSGVCPLTKQSGLTRDY